MRQLLTYFKNYLRELDARSGVDLSSPRFPLTSDLTVAPPGSAKEI